MDLQFAEKSDLTDKSFSAPLFEKAINDRIPTLSKRIAFLGRLKPMGMLFASLLMSITYLGAENVQIGFGIPRATTSIFQGALLLYLLATDFFINFEIRIARAQPE